MSETIKEQKASIMLIPYNREWPLRYLQAESKLRDCLGDMILSIDHIGSTSVPELSAKDRIDIQITVENISEEFKENFDKALLNGGFQASRWKQDHRPTGDCSPELHWKKLYVTGVHSKLNFDSNIHIRVKDYPNQIYPLLFRDYLRSHKDSAMAYQKLKEELARFHHNDRIAYCEIKDPVCDLIMVEAKKWAQQTQWKPI